MNITPVLFIVLFTILAAIGAATLTSAIMDGMDKNNHTVQVCPARTSFLRRNIEDVACHDKGGQYINDMCLDVKEIK